MSGRMRGVSNNALRQNPEVAANVQKDDAKRLRLVATDTDMGKELQTESNPGNNKHVKGASRNGDTKTVESSSIKNSTVTTVDHCGHHRSVTEVTDDTLTSLNKPDIGDPLTEKRTLQAGIAKWEEKLRRLSLVKSHKGNLSKLQQLTARWQQLMDHMGIDENMLELDREQDCFNC
ncbi:Swi five-dependent recombination repair protein Sfr1 [Branchiostoma belcheri]|nr:Swi five-dependent recombination repair protein Sfr1 [Branchiostoma belcheri]